jgi:hypothetical protein
VNIGAANDMDTFGKRILPQVIQEIRFSAYCARKLQSSPLCLTDRTSMRRDATSLMGQRTNPLARERAARGAEFVATTEDAVEMR